jgi:peroxiredoxin
LKKNYHESFFVLLASLAAIELTPIFAVFSFNTQHPALSTGDLFGGQRVVLFAVPGAFTPTCSNTHLPGYEAAYEEIKKEGVDEVFCLSVNDVSRYTK